MKTRGAISNPHNRFHHQRNEYFEALEREPETQCFVDNARTIISKNQSPDLPFHQSINPYKGCERGCIYCFARPTHAYLDLSPGLDFETKIFAKTNAAELLEAELGRRNYRCQTIALGSNTDPYQPQEKKRRITRSLLKTALRFKQPIGLITKSGLVKRDIDILSQMADLGLIQVMVSVTTLDREIKRKLEPRAPNPSVRLGAVEALSKANIPVGVLVAPIIPRINDHELEAIMKASANSGALSASYVMLRLPHELKQLFKEWLQWHYPMRAEHVLSIMRQSHAGREYNPKFGLRMRGSGPFANMIEKRFNNAKRKHGLDKPMLDLNCDSFAIPAKAGDQMALF